MRNDINLVQETSVVEVKPGAYAKAALLAYPRLRRLEAALRSLVHNGKTKAVNINDINDLLEAAP